MKKSAKCSNLFNLHSFRLPDRRNLQKLSSDYFEEMGALLSDAAGVELSFKTRECQMALEELIQEDLIPMFTYICGQVLKE